jgi:hypothetical protein
LSDRFTEFVPSEEFAAAIELVRSISATQESERRVKEGIQLKTGGIVGIILAVVGLLAIAVGIILFGLRRRAPENHHSEDEDYEVDQEITFGGSDSFIGMSSSIDGIEDVHSNAEGGSDRFDVDFEERDLHLFQ